MKQLFRKINTMRILSFFLENPYAETHLREIARRLRMSPSTVMRATRLLEKEDLVRRRSGKNATFFKPTMSTEFKALKIACTISKLEEKGITELFGRKSRGLSSVLLYGSAAKGEDSPESDYDFLAIAAESDVKALELSEKLGRECNLQVYSVSEWKEASRKNRPFYLEVISNSISLMGEKPVID